MLDAARSLFPAFNADSLLQLINAKSRAGEYRLPDDERQLQIKFISMTRSLSPFGETYFHAKDRNNNECLLAVSKVCIAWYTDGILEEKFSIDRIRRWMATPEKHLFQMEIDRGYSELCVKGIVTYQLICNSLALCRAQSTLIFDDVVKMPAKEWITSESAEIQALLDGYVQLTLRHKRMNSKTDAWSGDERMI